MSTDQKAPKAGEVPKDQSAAAQAAAPLASLSTHVDPFPSYLMSGVCLGGAGWAYGKMGSPRSAAVAGAFAVLYGFSGRLLSQGHERLGYDVGTVTSLGLMAVTGPAAWATGEAYTTAMATAGGMSSVANLVKALQYRTGKPHEPRGPERVIGGRH